MLFNIDGSRIHLPEREDCIQRQSLISQSKVPNAESSKLRARDLNPKQAGDHRKI
jgi:hypothetical protein